MRLSYPIASLFMAYLDDRPGEVEIELAPDLYRIILHETSRIVRTHEIPGLKEFFLPMPWGTVTLKCVGV